MNDSGSIFASKELLEAIPDFISTGQDPLGSAEIKISSTNYPARILSICLNEMSVEVTFKTNKENSLIILREALDKRLQVSILPISDKFIISSVELSSSYEIKLLAARVNN